MTGQRNEYGVVIIGGRVIDPETGLDAIRNVGIRGEKIAAVTEKAMQSVGSGLKSSILSRI